MRRAPTQRLTPFLFISLCLLCPAALIAQGGALVVALRAGTVAAREDNDRRGLKPEDFFELRTVGDPQISPDGSRIVYTLSVPDRNTDKSASSLWIARSDGSDNRPLAGGSGSESSPRWSPDGMRIAFLSDRSGSTQIHVRWLDSGQEAAVTGGSPSPANPAWSPDGRWLAFTRRVAGKTRLGGAPWEIAMPPKPASAKWGEPPVVVTDLRWHQDGLGITRPGSTHVFVVPADGGTPRQVSTGDYDYSPPVWMPDGDSLLTTANRHPDGHYHLEGGEIYAFPVRGGTVRRLTDRAGRESSPVPSPDGKRIAFTGSPFTGKSYEIDRLHVMNADGSDVRCLTQGLDRDVRGPAWAPDGGSLLVSVEDQGSIHLRRVSLEGEVTPLTDGPHVFGPFTMAKNGQVAATCSRATEPGNLFTLSLSHPGLKRLTAVNQGLLDQVQVSRAEEIWIDSFDGKRVQGWIVKPPDFDPQKKYPLLLYIHGGPHSMYSVAFNPDFQMHAAAGYVVLYTNPRGSTGYGHSFGVSIWRQYPKDDFRDLMAAVDAVIARGYVDPKRMAITGGSGGGCLTAWCIGQTDRFAAAAAQYPVTNWITQVGTADGGYFHAKMWLDGMPWENPQFYLERSPIFYAKNFKTPTMVITGEDDRRTPIAQSEELYLALKAQKVDAVLVRIPQEPHGAGRNFVSHRIAKVLYLMKWFDRYCKQ